MDRVHKHRNTSKGEVKMTKQEIIEDILINIDIYPNYEVMEILEDADIPLKDFIAAYDIEFG